ncbi:hypothetical protein BaRGS_00029702 [Batillaria attramentaria]|uniref:Ig-like domain-containing protein n=1 Tax=Batillaria attramentaria TaxID=370345 RepID=A0ABD0JVE0_9CAEN
MALVLRRMIDMAFTKFVFFACFSTFVEGAELGIKPLTDCPTYVDEGASLSCSCKSPRPGISADISWPGHSDNPQLTLANIPRGDDGKNFTCQMVFNGQITEVVHTIHLAYGPSDIYISGPSEFVSDGTRKMTLTCETGDVNPAPMYKWIGVTCDTGNTYRTCSYTPKPDVHNGKTVTCKAVNPSSHAVMSDTAHFTMNISYKSAVVDFTANGNRHTTTVSEETPLVFSCAANGRPAPNLTIHRLDSDFPLLSSSGTQEIVYQNGSIRCLDAGTYICSAENGFPNPSSRTIDVSVTCGSGHSFFDAGMRMKLIIGGGAFGGLVLIVVVIMIICRHRCEYLVFDRRYERPPPRRDEDEENPYTGLNVHPTPPELPPRRENYELQQIAIDENLYDELQLGQEQKPKKRSILCPNRKKKKKSRVNRDS